MHGQLHEMWYTYDEVKQFNCLLLRRSTAALRLEENFSFNSTPPHQRAVLPRNEQYGARKSFYHASMPLSYVSLF